MSSEPGLKYNVPLINSLVLHVGTTAITYIHSKGSTPSMATITHSSHMDIFQNLAVDLDTEGKTCEEWEVKSFQGLGWGLRITFIDGQVWPSSSTPTSL